MLLYREDVEAAGLDVELMSDGKFNDSIAKPQPLFIAVRAEPGRLFTIGVGPMGGWS